MKVSRVNYATWALSPFTPRLQSLAKIIPGLTWRREVGGYCGHWDAVKLACVTLGEDNVVGIDAFNKPAECAAARVTETSREYQQDGVRFLLTKGREGCLLADDMGLGKTAQALLAARRIGKRTLVVCPNYVRDVWQKELAKWWPEGAEDAAYPHGVKNCDAAGLEVGEGPPLVVIIHYDILHAWADTLEAWGPGFVIFDEGHMLQGERTQRSKAARQVSANAEYRVALTGTPMTNRPRDLWNLVDTLSPGRFGNYFQFGVRYAGAHQEQVTPEKSVWKFDGRSNEDELRARLSHFMLRRLKSDVALELPPKTRQIIEIEIPAKHRRMGDSLATSGNMRRWLDFTADEKLPEAWEIIKGHLDGGHKVVAFTWRKSVAEWLGNQAALAKFPVEICHGGISGAKRGVAIERAKSAEGGLLVATIDSTGVGIDLSFADVGVFVELDYRPHALLQAESRLHRYGASLPVLIQYLIAVGTTDELVANIVVGKLDAYEQVLGPSGEKLGADLRGSEEDVLSQMASAIERAQKEQYG